MKKIIFLSFLCLFALITFSQNLDRISISSGGSSTDEVNYVIGEIFNFSLADGATIILETGTLGSTDNSGGNNNFVKIDEVAKISKIACYPNPAKDVIYYAFPKNGITEFKVSVFDISGKMVQTKTGTYSEIMACNISQI
jgi:hypothetical protein